MTGPVFLRRALNQWRCRRCGAVIVAEFPICPPCAEHLERLDLAREVLAQAELERLHPWPPPRRRPRS